VDSPGAARGARARPGRANGDIVEPIAVEVPGGYGGTDVGERFGRSGYARCRRGERGRATSSEAVTVAIEDGESTRIGLAACVFALGADHSVGKAVIVEVACRDA